MKTIKNARLTRIVVLAMVICMAVSLLLPTTALAANAAVNDAKNGVVQVRVTYTDDAGSVEDLFSGTGFLINDNTVLTCNHVVTLTAGELAALAEVYQKTVPEFQSRLKIAITVSRDVTIDATVINSSATMDFAILRLSTSLQGKKALAIRSSETVEQTEHVFAIGFPAISSDSQSFSTYTSEDATIAEGVVNKNGAYFDANVKYLQTSCELDFGNSGGPMVDENGNVIGLCAGYLDSAASAVYFAVCIDQVTEVLSALGIPYTPATSQPVVEPTTEPTTEPTEEEPPATTVPVLPPPDIPDDFVDNDPVEPKSNMGLILIIAAVAVAVVVIIVVVVVAGGKKKKPVAPPVPPAPPAPPVPPVYAAPSQSVPRQRPPYQPYGAPPRPADPTHSAPGKYAKQGGKKKGKAGLIVAIVLLLAAIIAFGVIFLPKLLGGNDVTGKYQATRINAMGMEATGESLALFGDCWLELKNEGICTMALAGETMDGTWELDGEKFSCTIDGETMTGTLKDGKIEAAIALDDMDMAFTFEKSSEKPASGNAGEAPVQQTEAALTADSLVGYWTLLRADSNFPDNVLTEEDVIKQNTILGTEIFLDLQAGGTGVGSFYGDSYVTWDLDTLKFKDLGITCMLSLSGDQLTLVMDFDANTRYVFVRGEGNPPAVDMIIDTE